MHDMKQAADFFINVLGCKEAMSFGPFADEKGNFMADLLNVNPRAVIHQQPGHAVGAGGGGAGEQGGAGGGEGETASVSKYGYFSLSGLGREIAPGCPDPSARLLFGHDFPSAIAGRGNHALVRRSRRPPPRPPA
jgi:hypothetical protein